MARKKGCRVVTCSCGTQVVGMPGKRKPCQHCKAMVTMPAKGKKAPAPKKKRSTAKRKGKR